MQVQNGGQTHTIREVLSCETFWTVQLDELGCIAGTLCIGLQTLCNQCNPYRSVKNLTFFAPSAITFAKVTKRPLLEKYMTATLNVINLTEFSNDTTPQAVSQLEMGLVWQIQLDHWAQCRTSCAISAEINGIYAVQQR